MKYKEMKFKKYLHFNLLLRIYNTLKQFDPVCLHLELLPPVLFLHNSGREQAQMQAA